MDGTPCMRGHVIRGILLRKVAIHDLVEGQTWRRKFTYRRLAT